MKRDLSSTYAYGCIMALIHLLLHAQCLSALGKLLITRTAGHGASSGFYSDPSITSSAKHCGCLPMELTHSTLLVFRVAPTVTTCQGSSPGENAPCLLVQVLLSRGKKKRDLFISLYHVTFSHTKLWAGTSLTTTNWVPQASKQNKYAWIGVCQGKSYTSITAVRGFH